MRQFFSKRSFAVPRYEKYRSQTFQRYTVFQNLTNLRWCGAFWIQSIAIFFIDFQDFSIIFLNSFKQCLHIEMYSYSIRLNDRHKVGLLRSNYDGCRVAINFGGIESWYQVLFPKKNFRVGETFFLLISCLNSGWRIVKAPKIRRFSMKWE